MRGSTSKAYKIDQSDGLTTKQKLLSYFQSLLKWAKPGLFLVYFRPFLNTMTIVALNLTINERS